MKVLTDYTAVEISIKNSRFISEVFVCESQAFAKGLIKSQKEKYFDATHVCHAFVIGENAEVLGMSDAGEPSGTAGRPMLDVLKGSGVTNILLTVTRYFGGTLLGTGGLVKAYGDCAKSILEKAAVQNAIEELVAKTRFKFCADYSLYETIKRQVKEFTLYKTQEDFGAEVTLEGQILEREFNAFAEKIKNLSTGRTTVIRLDS